MSEIESKSLIAASEIGRTIQRMAYEILERNGNFEDLAFIGIESRGVILARRISDFIEKVSDKKIKVGSLDVSLYRDDLKMRKELILPKISKIDFPLDGKIIVLFDDVLFTGRTTNAAIRSIFDLGRPEKIELAVLIDRGHREIPIRPDYCGKNIPTRYVQKIEVMLSELDGKDLVVQKG